MARPLVEALADLDAIVDAARREPSTRGYFAAVYRSVTAAVADAVDDGVFADGARMELLAAQLVARYTDAVAGRSPGRGWRVALRATQPDRAGYTMIVQHLALGLNAHVNADLPVLAARIAPGDAIDGLAPDFAAINGLVARFLDAAQDAIGRFSPLLARLDEVGGRSDEQVAGFAVDQARDDAWRHARVLAALPEPLRDDAADLLDRRSAFLGRLVADPPFPVGPVARAVAAGESRDVVAVIDALDLRAPGSRR